MKRFFALLCKPVSCIVLCSFLVLFQMWAHNAELAWLLCACALLLSLSVIRKKLAVTHDATIRLSWIGIGVALALDACTLAFAPHSNGAAWYVAGVRTALWSDFLFTFALGVRLQTPVSRRDTVCMLAAFAVHVCMLAAQPNIVAATVQVLAVLGLVFLAGKSLFRMQLGAGCMVALLFLLSGVIVSRPYLLRRLGAWLTPHADPFGAGFQHLQYQKAFSLAGFFGAGPSIPLPGSWEYSALPSIALQYGAVAALVVVVVILAVFAGLWGRIRQIENSSLRQGAFGVWLLLALMQALAVAFSFGLAPASGNCGLLFVGDMQTGCAMLLLALATHMLQPEHVQSLVRKG